MNVKKTFNGMAVEKTIKDKAFTSSSVAAAKQMHVCTCARVHLCSMETFLMLIQVCLDQARDQRHTEVNNSIGVWARRLS